ncbi:MAG: hypothetical protein JWP00_2984 [Chloroflexi bacterium]|jgi:hypothetical protein|nr:hypothetical protein [Chloroflexota bacterium]
MNNEGTYPQLIASNSYSWCVYRQATDRIHFDFGQTGLLLSFKEFKVLGLLLEEACRSGMRRGDGLLAGISSQRAIFGCGQAHVAVLIFDHAVFRFQRRDIEPLFELWRQAAARFEQATNMEIVDYKGPNLAAFSVN